MRSKIIYLTIFVLVLVWSAIQPHDYFTWFLEVFPAIIGVLLLIFTNKKFEFTNFAYFFILVHCCILCVGGHYTYAEVPLFDWIKETFHQTRNNYDKVGHFAQGFIPAIITREIIIRKGIINNSLKSCNKWTNFITVTICLSISAVYEFLEWFVAVFSGSSAEAFLGTQGYEWDTQSDMLYATIGATIMILLFAKYHNNQIRKKYHKNNIQ